MHTVLRMRTSRRLLVAVTVVLLAACGGGGADEAATESADAATTAPAVTQQATADTGTEDTGTEDAGAGGEAEGAEATTDADTDSSAATEQAAAVMLADSDVGEIIADGQGRSLYLLTADSPGESTCFDACAAAWPPFTVEDDPAAGEGVDQSLLGTIDRDGAMHVTYGDWPLYYFQGDGGPGETAGQGIESFGGVWWLVGPDGQAIEGSAVSAATGGGY